jgi:Zn-dependent M32 family carboxypeptidase
VNNNHKWFFVNEELYNLYQRLKGKRVIIVGGADSECLQDVYISMKSFGIIPTYNHKYIYNASMNDDMKSTDKQENV